MVAHLIHHVGTLAIPPQDSELSLRSLELFSGAGGLALGTHLAGFLHSALIEWDHNAHETLRRNVEADAVPGINKWRVLKEDVRSISFREFGTIDLIAGGPPCQPFSIAGKHQGMDDARNMIPEFVRAIRELTPGALFSRMLRGSCARGSVPTSPTCSSNCLIPPCRARGAGRTRARGGPDAGGGAARVGPVSWTVVLTASTQRDLRRLDRPAAGRVLDPLARHPATKGPKILP